MNISRLFTFLGVKILMLMSLTLVFSSSLLLLGVSIKGFVFIIAYLVTSFLLWIFTRNTSTDKQTAIKFFVLISLIFIVVFMFFLFISHINYDQSWDGQTYQQEGIIQLKEGWNPIYDEPLDYSIRDNLWVNHYAKGPWIISATLYNLTGHIEHGKVFNFLLIIAAFSLSFVFFYDRFKKFNISLILSLIITLNPVAINQAFSFYTDGHIASLLTALLMLMLLYLYGDDSKKNLYLLGIFFSIILIANIKFTALGYAIIFAGIPILLSINFKARVNYKRFLISVKKEFPMSKYITSVVVAFLIAVVIVGFNPYITNFINNGHPFYPLAGEGKEDIITGNAPYGVTDKNRFENFIRSYFSYSTNDRTKEPVLKVPFTVNLEEIKQMGKTDTRVAGFGPLFGGILILIYSVILLMSRDFFSKKASIYIIIISIILVSIFINPEPWWARYVPQLWLIPVLILFFAMKVSDYRLTKVFNSITILLMATNILLSSSPLILKQVDGNAKISKQLEILAEYSENYGEIDVEFDRFRSNRARLAEAGVKFNTVQNLDCNNIFTLTNSTVKVCVHDNMVYNQLVETTSK